MKSISTAKDKSIVRNSLFLFIAQMFLSIFTLASSILIARNIGPYVTGQYTYLIWIGSTFTALGTLGIPNALIKFIAEYSESSKGNIAKLIAGNLLLSSTILGLITAIILAVLTFFHFFPNNTQTIFFYMIALTIPLTTLSASIEAAFSGNRRYSSSMNAVFITSPITFLGLLIVLYYMPTLQGLVMYYVASSLFSVAVDILLAKRNIEISFVKLPKKVSRTILNYVFVVSGILLLDQIVWNRSEVIFLGHYSTPQQVAFYSLSYSITASVMTLFPGSIIGALMPHVAALQGIQNTKEIISSYQKAVKYIGLIVALIIGGSIALATPFVYTIYGANYSQMIPVFRILIITSGIASVGSVAITILYGTTQQKTILKIGLILSLLNLLLDFAIIPYFGAVGASVANGVSQTLGSLLGISILIKRGIPFPITTYIKICGITLLSCLTMLFLTNHFGSNTILTLIIGSVFYLILFSALAIITKLITRKEISHIHIFQTSKV